MSGVYIKNFSYSVFLSFLLLVLVSSTISKQGRYIKNFQQFEKYLIIKRIINLDTLLPFSGMKGVLPKQQIRKQYRLEFLKGKFALITIPVIPVNTKFVESKQLPGIHGLIPKCTCDSNNEQITNDSLENEKFLTYKIIVLPRSPGKNDIQFEGFKLFVTNTELTREIKTQQPCLKAGNIQYYLEGYYYWNGKPYPRIDSNIVNEELLRIKQINGEDKQSDEEFYLSTVKEKDLVIKIPILDISLDTKKSRNTVILISLCFAAFSLNMFRMARINFIKNKGIEPFFLYNVSRDVSRTTKSLFRISIFNIRIDSFFILIYHFLAFLSPLIIVIITYLPKYEGENWINKTVPTFLGYIGACYFAVSFFYNYLLLFTNKTGFAVFKEAVINMFSELPDIPLNKFRSSFLPPKWLKKIFLLLDKIFKGSDISQKAPRN